MKELDEIEKRANAATEGPWKMFPWPEPKHQGYKSCDRLESMSKDKIICMVEAFCEPICKGKCDLTFIAHARTDIPRLVKALRQIIENRSCCNLYDVGMSCDCNLGIQKILRGEE